MRKIAIWVLMLAMMAATILATSDVLWLPAASTTYQLTQTFNVQVDGGRHALNTSGASNVTNVTWQYSTDGTTWTYLTENSSGIAVDTAGTLLNWTVRVDTHQFYDQNTHQFRALVQNSSGATLSTLETITANTNVLFDNNVPISTVTKPIAETKYSDAETFEGTCTNASSATIVFGSNRYGMTVSGSDGAETCSVDMAFGEPSSGHYDVYMLTTDTGGTNTTTSATIRNVWIEPSTGIGPKIFATGILEGIMSKPDERAAIFIALIILVIILSSKKDKK